MQSIQSTALEPTRSEIKELSLGRKIARFVPVYGLVILTVALILIFSILLPNTFPTLLNLRSIVSNKAIIALLSLAAMIPMAAGRIDLTIGYGIVLWHILAISLQTMYGFPWPVAVLVVLALGVICGFLNGLLVEVAKIDSFIATLGTGTVLYAIALWHTGGRQVVGVLPDGFYALNGTMIFGLPITGFYVLAIAALMYVVLEYLPIGRYVYAIGGNPDAARLAGIKVWAVLIFVYGMSGLLAGLGGGMQAARLYAANGLQLGQSYELDAITAVILGGTSFVGGIGSIWGTLVGALIIAVLSNGLILVGVSDIWQYVIKGLVIIGAVALDRYRLQGSART